jgi:hypothetical protein
MVRKRVRLRNREPYLLLAFHRSQQAAVADRPHSMIGFDIDRRLKMSGPEQLPVIIKLYPNRRLYDGETGSYRSLDELRAWKRRQLPFSIVDSSTGDDVTASILS